MRIGRLLLSCVIGASLATAAQAQRVEFPTTVQGAPQYGPPQTTTVYQPGSVYAPGAPPPYANVEPLWDPYHPAPAQPAVVAPYEPVPVAGPFVPVQVSRGGIIFGFEAAILQARPGTFAFTAPDEIITLTPDFDLTFSPRVFAGYEWAQGFGLEARWWYYDADGGGSVFSTAGDATDVSVSSSIRMNVIDGEATQTGKFSNWEFKVGGGVRYAQITLGESATFTADGDDFDVDLDSQFTGVGPTLAVWVRRPFNFWEGFAFVTDARFSFLFGDSDITLTAEENGAEVVSLGPVSFQEHAVTVFEARVGAEWSRYWSDWRFTLGGYFEGQVWGWGPPLGIGNDSLGFWGPTFQIAIMR